MTYRRKPINSTGVVTPEFASNSGLTKITASTEHNINLGVASFTLRKLSAGTSN